MNELQVYFASDDADTLGFRTINVTGEPPMRAWWPSGPSSAMSTRLYTRSS
ncbi:MAG: hypothetical protein WKH64_17185 [Chloroflexia bacterium]